MIIVNNDGKNFFDLTTEEQDQLFKASRTDTVFVTDINGEKFQVLDLTEGKEEEWTTMITKAL